MTRTSSFELTKHENPGTVLLCDVSAAGSKVTTFPETQIILAYFEAILGVSRELLADTSRAIRAADTGLALRVAKMLALGFDWGSGGAVHT